MLCCKPTPPTSSSSPKRCGRACNRRKEKKDGGIVSKTQCGFENARDVARRKRRMNITKRVGADSPLRCAKPVNHSQQQHESGRDARIAKRSRNRAVKSGWQKHDRVEKANEWTTANGALPSQMRRRQRSLQRSRACSSQRLTRGM